MLFDNDFYDFSQSWLYQVPTGEPTLPWEQSACDRWWNPIVDFFDDGGPATDDYDHDGDVDLHDLAAKQREVAATLKENVLTYTQGVDMENSAAFLDQMGRYADQFQGDTNQPRNSGGNGPGGDNGGIN